MDKKNRRRKQKNNTLWVLLEVLVAYTILTLVCTYLYNCLPLPRINGIWGRDSFYESFIQGMYNSIADFLFFTLILSVVLNHWEQKSKIRKYHEEIEACRFWNEPQAAFRLRSLIFYLQQEDIYEVNLTKCYMENIKLKGIHLKNSELMGARVDESNLEHSEFAECNCRGVYFENAILRSCKFKECKLEYLKCKNANLKSIEIYNSILFGSDFTNTDLRAAIIKNCSLKSVKFENCNLERANLLGCTEIDINELVKSRNLKYIKVDDKIRKEINNKYPDIRLE